MRQRPTRGAIVRRRAVAAGLLAVALALVVAATLGGGKDSKPERAVAQASRSHSAADARVRRRVRAALERGVHAAGLLGGAVEAGVMLGPWKEPAIAAATRGDASRSMRMWSMSKVLTLVALLRANGWGAKPGKPLKPEVSDAARAAITRSENCPERRVVLELQHGAGGSAQAAREAMSETLAVAGAKAEISSESAPPDSSCVPYLESQHEIEEPLGEALLAGISTWTIDGAVRFSEALSTGVYGQALTRRVLGLMRLPKERSRVVQASEYTPALDWGAGRALDGMNPAYKSGWGGVEQGEFMAGQIVVADPPGGGRVALAVMFHPYSQPSLDDPGRTAAPLALERVMEAVAGVLR